MTFAGTARNESLARSAKKESLARSAKKESLARTARMELGDNVSSERGCGPSETIDPRGGFGI